MISNLAIAPWREAFVNLLISSTMLDRSVHRAAVLRLKPNAYRLKKHQPAAARAT